jgi:hypothetical protein
MGELPMLGNLAWAPLPAIDNLEVLDRFNGVPTLGLFTAGGERQMFWRALGYVPDTFSIWIYVPVDAAGEQRLLGAESADLLAGLVFESRADRYVTVGVAGDYRLIFEREWLLPAGMSPVDLLHEMLRFLNEALDLVLAQDLPPGRRELMRDASRAVKELAAAG